MEIINFLHKVFKLSEVKDFISKSAERKRKPDEKYKSWIGFNYKQNKLDSVKLYFAYYDELTPEFISSLFSDKQTKLYFRDYEKRNTEAIISSYEFGSGFAIGLKIDTDLNVTKAFGYNLRLEQCDSYFLSERGFKMSDILPHKGVYHHFMKDMSYEKQYYYFKNKEVIINKLEEIQMQACINTPILEVGFGKGFYKDSNASDEKYILLGNYEEVFKLFIANDIAFSALKADFHTLEEQISIEGFCPGIYQNLKVQSFYIGYKQDGIIHFDSIEKIVAKIA